MMKEKRAVALAIQLLGRFQVSVRGKTVEDDQWPRPQAKLLLKLLAIDAKHQLHRQQIIDAIWPDLDPEAGAANLHKIIHLARRALDTIAVLPFHNDTGDSNLTYLASGIAESLIKTLSRLPHLRVLSYSAVARYKTRDLNPRRLGRSLMVRALATGRIHKINDALTVAVELVDTADGSVRCPPCCRLFPSDGSGGTRRSGSRGGSIGIRVQSALRPPDLSERGTRIRWIETESEVFEADSPHRSCFLIW